jgi:hypothetical protein
MDVCSNMHTKLEVKYVTEINVFKKKKNLILLVLLTISFLRLL